MGAFLHGFSHGIHYGMFHGMFGGPCYAMNPFVCNPFMPTFFMPNFHFGGFFPYQQPMFNAFPMFGFNSFPYGGFNTNFSVFNYATPNFNVNIDTFVPSTSYFSDNGSKKIVAKTEKKPIKEENLPKEENSEKNDNDFDKMLSFVLRSEGGYVANDGGQACNKGIQQSTYDSYRTKKGLSKQDVKNITDEEVKDIYYTMYYKASGADKIDDPKLALYVFDTAVNMGVSAAKRLLEKSGNNADKFEEARLERYEEIAQNNPSKSKYLRGWENRVQNAENFANRELLA